MNETIKISLPIHYKIPEKVMKRKTKKLNVGEIKKSKTFIVGMNWYRNAHYILSNEVKKHYSDLIKEQLKDNKIKFNGEYKVKYTLYYSSRICDLGNVCSLMSKFVNDVLQELGIIVNDNVQYLTRELYKVGGIDKTEPRVVIEIVG